MSKIAWVRNSRQQNSCWGLILPKNKTKQKTIEGDTSAEREVNQDEQVVSTGTGKPCG